MIGTRDLSQSRSDSPVHHVLLKNDFSHSISYPTINTLIPMKCKELPKRIFERETLEKNKIDSSTILYIWFSKFRVMRRFLVFGKQFKRKPIHIGWCNGLIARLGKQEKTQFDVTLLEQEAWMAIHVRIEQGTWPTRKPDLTR